MRDKYGRFIKGHKCLPGSEKGWFKPGKHNSFDTEFKQGKCLGENHPRWGGGIKTNYYGYIFIYQIDHPFRNKANYVKRSRLIMEEHLGRYLTPKEQVHHKGVKYPIKSIQNRQDDRIENLMLFKNNSAHKRFHYNPDNVKPEEIIFNGSHQ